MRPSRGCFGSTTTRCVAFEKDGSPLALASSGFGKERKRPSMRSFSNIQRMIAIAIAPSVPGRIGTQRPRSPLARLLACVSTGSTTTYDSLPSVRALATRVPCRLNGLPACPGAVPTNSTNSALAKSGLACGRPFRSPNSAADPER